MSRPLFPSPDIRQHAATEALLLSLPDLPAGDDVFVADDDDGGVEAGLVERGHAVRSWNRVTVGPRIGKPWPAEGVCQQATLRFQRDRDAFEVALHATAARLAPGGRLFVYGANDEGVKSADTRIGALFSDLETLSTMRHCRVWMAVRPAEIPGLKPTLADWKTREPVEMPWGPVPWTRYPGLFAKGGLDAGTALLLHALPKVADGAQVLDFACGTGVISAAVLKGTPSARVQMIDSDALAIAAARENAVGAMALTGDGPGALPAWQRYHHIFSNPPLHRGKDRTRSVLEALVRAAPPRLLEGGDLWLVVQRHEPVEPLLRQCFLTVDCPSQDGHYAVWRAADPFSWAVKGEDTAPVHREKRRPRIKGATEAVPEVAPLDRRRRRG
jgi:16S rRNA (guanine1207-N2)-methyltransferase